MNTYPACYPCLLRQSVEAVQLTDHQADQQVGYDPQGRLLFPSMTVDEHLRFAWQKLSIFVIQRSEQVCRYLRSQGIAILLIEQNLEMARGLADRAYFFNDGQVTHEIDGDESNAN
jgi:ABC-type branched-subunit amino acid transport system ATPase component